MQCFHPVDAWQNDDGRIVFTERGGGRALSLPCGQCIGCRVERSRQWAMRCVHESRLYERNSFVTLTYNDDNCPNSLEYRNFQLFMKKARKKLGPFRFYMCGEYGERTFRPHYHALLFGLSFDDMYYWRQSESGCRVYRSSTLESLWTLGNCEIGEVTFESAAYVASYCVKKITGDAAEEHYTRVDSSTGEIVKVLPEFSKMSLRPGIGARFVAKYRDDIYPHDYVIVDGRKVKPPRYYDKWLFDQDGTEVDEVAFARVLKGRKFAFDGTPDRLAVRERVLRGRLSFKKRALT